MPRPAPPGRPLPPTENAPQVPGWLGDYLLLTRVAKGGMADVLLAEPRGKENSGEFLAVKVLLPDLAKQKKFIDMFRSEGKLGLMLNHQSIVKTIEVGSQGAIHFIVMEFIDGQDLGRVLRFFRNVKAPLPIPSSLYVAVKVLEGLGHAHTLRDETGQILQLVNRDVSPANIMVSYDGSIRIIDFGIAQALLNYRSQIGSIKGKIPYMSPEQVRGLAVDARSDIFSLGTTLYEMLTCSEPFRAPTEFEQMERVREANPPPASELNRRVDKELSDIIAKSMAKEANERFSSANEMVDAIRDYCQAKKIELNGDDMNKFMHDELGSSRDKFLDTVAAARRILEEPIEVLEAEDLECPTSSSNVTAVERTVKERTSLSKMSTNPKWLLPAFIGLLLLATALVVLALMR